MLMVGKTVSPLKMPSNFPKVKSSPSPEVFAITKVAQGHHKGHDGPCKQPELPPLSFSLETRNVPSVWMLSLPTTE